MTIAGLDVTEILELALLLVGAGALSGFLAGMFGIGGGAILVPVFYEGFRLAHVPIEARMPLCVGSLCARCCRYDYPQGLVVDDRARRGHRERDCALCAGAVVQISVRGGGVVGLGANAAGARDLGVRRRDADGVFDAQLWLWRRPCRPPDGGRWQALLQ